MNDDDHGTVVPANDYRYAKNVHIMYSNDGGVAAIKNVPGTTEVPFTLGGTSGQKVVGSIEDEEHNRVFYFVKTTLGNHEILCYDRTSNIIRRVLSDSILTSVDGQPASLVFSTDYLVTGVAFIYPWLFWTDNYNAPRRINVERGMRTYDPTYLSPDLTVPVAYTTPLDYRDISIVREPPRFPIEVRKLVSTDEASVPDQPTNQIELAAFQFSYRFLYRDGSLSVLAPYSKVVNFNSDTIPDLYDTVEVKIPKRQEIPEEVDEVQVLVKDPLTNNWGIIKRYRRVNDETLYDTHNTLNGAETLVFNFFNNYSSTAIPEADGIKLFDSVPIKSQALEVAHNRIFLANNLEGYDPLESLILKAELDAVSTGTDSQFVTYILVFPDTVNCNPAYYAVIVIRVETGDPLIDGYYFVEYTNTVNWANGTLPTELYISPSNKIGTLNDFQPGVGTLTGYYATLWGCPSPGPNNYVLDNYIGQQPTVYGLGNDDVIEEGDAIFKTGARYQIGIVFYDYAGRNNGVYTNDDCLVYIPDRTFTSPSFQPGIAWLIDGVVNNNNIPLWATHYSIVRTKNLSTSFFLQHYITADSYVTLDDDGAYVYQETYPGSEKVFALAWDIGLFYRAGFGYTFAQGDILKLYPENDGDPQYYAITGQEGNFLFTTPKNLGSLSGYGITGLGEIYTPIAPSEQPLFYEVGEVYPIANAGTASKEFTVYSGVLRGDVIFKARDIGDEAPLPLIGTLIETENMSPNDNLWQVWNTDAGRPNIVLYDSKQERRETAIRWSNQYVAGAKINGLCTFDEVDEVVLDESCGPIQKLVLAGKAQSEGSVMLSIGANNTFSMYLGETQIVDNSEQTLLATSGKIIGTTRDLRGGYGTNHPESVVENDGRVYWYDEQRGAVVRYAANGLTPVSDYKFRAFFNRLSNYTRNQPVIGGFDRLRTEYLLCVTSADVDTDVEWLNDYLDDLYFRDRLLTSTALTSLNATVYEGASYTLDVEWANAGLFTLYIDDTVIATQNFVGEFDNHTIEFTASQTGTLKYFFLPKGSPPRGSATLYGPNTSPHQAWRGEDFTIGFRDVDGMEGFTSFYSFTPEWFSKSGNLLLSFRNGKLYRHDNESAYNTFYGTQYVSGIAWVTNTPIPTIKWPASVGIQSNYTPTWVHIRTEIPYVQSTDLEGEDFVLREGFYYADVLRDRLSPNVTGSFYDKSLKGDKIRSSLLEVYVEFSTFADELYVYLVKLMWQPSSGHF